jgi:hypothetical protein
MKKRKKKRLVSQAPGVIVPGRSPKTKPLSDRALEAYRRRYQRGDSAALLRALDLWLDCFRGPPAWIADEFFDAISRWLAGATLDEAFRVQRVPGEHVDRRRQREDLRPRIILEVTRLAQQNAPMDDRTFGRVGDEIGQSAGYVRTVYYESESVGWKNLLRHFHVRREPLKNSTK